MRFNMDLNIQGLPDWDFDALYAEVMAEHLRRNPPKRVLPPLSSDEMRMVRFDMMIHAIKAYRARVRLGTDMPGLKETKDLCDIYREECKRLGMFVDKDK